MKKPDKVKTDMNAMLKKILSKIDKDDVPTYFKPWSEELFKNS